MTGRVDLASRPALPAHGERAELAGLAAEASTARAARVLELVGAPPGSGPDRVERVGARFRYAMMAEGITTTGTGSPGVGDRIEAMVSAVVLASARPRHIRLVIDGGALPHGGGSWLCIVLREMMAVLDGLDGGGGSACCDVVVTIGDPAILVECARRDQVSAVLRAEGAAALSLAARIARAFGGTVRRRHGADGCTISAEFPHGVEDAA